MVPTILVVLTLCGLVHSSGFPHAQPLAAVGPSVVTSASSQYFERTFNRLVAAPLQPVIPVAPVAPAPPVFVEPVTRTVPAVPVAPAQNVPVEPNVAIAVATAHAAAPVATILLPPYPFAPPPSFGFVHPIVVPEPLPKNVSTPKPTTASVQTTVREPEPTTPLPSGSPSNTDNIFAQALPSNQNNINQVYGPPQQLPSAKPQKLRTSVEVVPVPLRYIAPPPIPHHHHHHHHHHPVKYVHAYAPAKLIIRPVRVHTVRVPARLVVHRVPVQAINVVRNQQKVIRSRVGDARDTEPTTFKPFNRPITKPPKV
ncbi:uncharacterized protein LOC126372676 [Pectinophora gossypiella]|uniref:uncharacterized protein LOC126372676 n=1 Tax=Pectinophora gossypiella TaxID=13191 RepID=UPI00214DFBDA|nr:uncharacterized protein LOC126372676 [Pectinophora gossypiella]